MAVERFSSPAGALVRISMLVVLLPSLTALGASTGSANLYMPQGSGAGSASGDFVSSAVGGLNTQYHYWVEVPPGLSRLRIQVYDADTGTAPEDANGTEGRDRIRNAANVSVRYTVVPPSGTSTIVNCIAGACSTNSGAWMDVVNSPNPVAGHWEVQVDQSSTVTTGDDINGIGIRADDGDETPGGTELNVYVEGMNQFGTHSAETAGNTKTYSYYPWITSGCTFLENDFDYDTGNGTGNGPGGTYGSFSLTSRSGSVTRSIASASLSANNVWKQNVVAAWGSDSDSTDYGIWAVQQSISTYVNNLGPNGNYTDVWFGNQGAVTPPTANPPANSFRLYLPTDAGTAPSKPYLEQMVRYTGANQTCNGAANGPNPPARNTVSCFTVTVRLVNPAGAGTGPITFSASNLVTANVPGTRVLYEGNAGVTQGSVTAQPVAGGSGNVTWNPGTVTAGTTALLSYVIRVRPTQTGQRNPVTGTVASGNGTRATYVDHTGAAAQAQAVPTIGPVCELAVTQGTLTEALVAGMRAREESGAVAVEWETASEAGTLGFYLERFDTLTESYERVGSRLVPALPGAPQGGLYRVLDPGVSPGEGGIQYRLVEVRTDGALVARGPFDLIVDRSGKGQEPLFPDSRGRSANAGASRGEAAGHLAVTLVPTALFPTDTSGVRIGVRETGLQYVSSAALAPLLGESQKKVELLIGTARLSLSKQGEPVWWMPAASAEKSRAPGLLFFGEAIRDPFAAEEVYLLQKSRGTTMPAVPVAAGSANLADTFAEVRHVETDSFPATVLPLDPESDYWFWTFLVGGDATDGKKTLTFDAPAVSGPGPGSLVLHLQGASSSGVAGEHHAVVKLNGVGLGERRFTGIAGQYVSLTVPAGLLRETGNQLQIDALLDPGVPYSVFYVNSFDVGYRRLYRAAGDALSFRPDGGAPVSIGGFSSADVTLLDVSDPLHPRLLGGASMARDASGFRVGFNPAGAGTSFLAAGPGGLKTPSLRPWLDGHLRSTWNGADYLVVTTSDLEAQAVRLAEYRRGQGLRSGVVNVEAVMNEFRHGRYDPKAIGEFLAAARSWSSAPRYVLLAGAGSLDYRNLLGHGDCLVPPIVVATPEGLFGSDNRLADLTGGDGVPRIAIGRVPVTTAGQLGGYVDKVIAYERDAGGWAGSLLALADVQDEGSAFAADSDHVLAQVAPSYAPLRIYLDSLSLEAARTQLMGGIQAGSSFVDYLGHGGLDRLSGGGLLTTADVPAMANGSRLPVLTAMTCEVNRFTVPGIPSLGEKLTVSPGGGAIAVWGPSALSIHGEARLLAEKFYSSVSAGAAARLGDLVLEAMTKYQGLGGNAGMLPIYVLMGDPALVWKAAPPSVTPPGPGGAGLE